MVITYKCKCGHEFDGHWFRAAERRARFPELAYLSDINICRICPSCGELCSGDNLDNDEDFN